MSAERDGVWWRFAVDDNGIGIDAAGRGADLRHVPAPAHARRTTRAPGIGLAIARKVVENHGGRIWAEPRPAGGTRMAFTLPAEEG